MQTGNDTEYALVVLALCVGAAYSFARFFLKPALLARIAKSLDHLSDAQMVLFFSRGSVWLLFDAASPPALPLRI